MVPRDFLLKMITKEKIKKDIVRGLFVIIPALIISYLFNVEMKYLAVILVWTAWLEALEETDKEIEETKKNALPKIKKNALPKINVN